MNANVRLIIGMFLLGVVLQACASAPQTPEDLKVFINNPYTLLGVMYLGAIGSWLTTVSTAKGSGSTVTFIGYLAHWETILGAVIAVPLAWGGLFMVDQLNFAAALAYGAVAQTSLDKFNKGGRTGTLMK